MGLRGVFVMLAGHALATNRSWAGLCYTLTAADDLTLVALGVAGLR